MLYLDVAKSRIEGFSEFTQLRISPDPKEFQVIAILSSDWSARVSDFRVVAREIEESFENERNFLVNIMTMCTDNPDEWRVHRDFPVSIGP